MKKIKISSAFIVLGLCIAFLTACGGGGFKEEIPMGRYAERDINLPGSGYEYMHSLVDGGYYLHGNGVDFTKVDSAGEIKQTPWAWENNNNVRLKTVFGISDNGATIFAFLPRFYTDDELEVLGTEDEILYKYYYVNEKGDRYLLDLHGDNYTPKEFFECFAFAPDGKLYGATYRHVCRIDLETEEVAPLFETSDSVHEFAFIGDTMIAIDRNKSYLYNMANDKLLDENTILNEFLTSHQSGSTVLAVGNGTDVTSQFNGQTLESVNTDSKVLYIGCRTGLYRYIWNGSVIEQIADGQMLTLGNSQYSPIAMQALDNGEFRILFSGNRMVEMYYDETIPARPSRELTVYSLEENARIRYAGQLFQKQNPDVLVVYETGMSGDNAVSKEDALRNLNTRLLAGEGPDVLILDDMDVAQYAEKGILKELDDFFLPYKEEGILYQNIVEGMRMTESDKIYAAPLNVFVPLYLSETKYLDGQTTLADLIAGAKFAREEHPDGPILYTPYQIDILNELLPVCIPTWTTADGSLQLDQITEFYQTADELWKLDSAGMDDAHRKRWQDYNSFNELSRIDILVGKWVSFNDYDETWINLSFAQDPFENMRQIHLTYSAFRETGGYLEFKQLDDVYAMGYDKFGGQAQDVYWVKNIIGLCEGAKEPELAEDFLALLLSDEMMRKWWLGSGYPIRKESLVKVLDINNREWAQVEGLSADSINIWYADYVWPTEEEKEWMYQILEEASCPYLPGSVLEQTVKEVGLRVLDGELTPEEGAAEVSRKMAIEMEE
ncbi:MAG: ABC transporter substrate-binding protein [Lachnospiraceae bacterium]|nr:ABC transporter substrate-binding protein [Lachnospiraceae bacterium]